MVDPETARAVKANIDRSLRDREARGRKDAEQVFNGYHAITELGPWRLHAIVTGTVQGVFFRAYVHRVATFLKLTGWVRNTAGDKVEVVAEGTRPLLEELLDKLQKGPPSAQVEEVKPDWKRATGEFSAFDIRV